MSTDNKKTKKGDYSRKLAAIMFTGIVGHSKLSQVNETVAIEQNLNISELNSLFHSAYVTLGGANIRKAMYQDAISTLSKASMFSKGHPIPAAGLGSSYAMAHRRDDVLMMLELLLERTEEEYVSPFWIAVIHTGLWNKDEVFR